MAVESRTGPTEFLGLGRSRFLWTQDRELNGVSRPNTHPMCHEREARQHRCSAIEPGRPNFFDARYGATGGVVDALSVFP